jgi:hypothetical protein
MTLWYRVYKANRWHAVGSADTIRGCLDLMSGSGMYVMLPEGQWPDKHARNRDRMPQNGDNSQKAESTPSLFGR